MRACLFFVCFFMFCLGCAPGPSNESTTNDAGAKDAASAPEGAPQESLRPKADYSRTQPTGDNRYKVSYDLPDAQLKEGELPLNRHFAAKVTVLDKDGNNVADKVDIVVDAAMLDHGHGTNVEPTVERQGDQFLVKGLLLHMPGKWTLYVHVRAKGTRPPNLKIYGEYYKYCEQSKKDCAVFHAYLP